MLHAKLAKITWGFVLLGVEIITHPSLNLLFVIGIAMFIDFITGVLKSKFEGKEITSEGFRRTVIKVLQYAIPILVLWGAGKYIPEYKNRMKEFSSYLMIFILYIEVTSIFENLYKIDSKSTIAKFLYRPALKVLKFGIENNPVADAANKLQKKDPDKIEP